MNDEERQFEDIDCRVSDELTGDLKALFASGAEVGGEVDRAVLDAARRRLARPRRKRRLAYASSIAAAAAVIVLVFVLKGPWEGESTAPEFAAVEKVAHVAGDVDRNGHVDVLDAFKLAKFVESSAPTDGKWDINGDGAVDRSDIDTIAFMAVRLDKGV